jgi:hypothetical protein
LHTPSPSPPAAPGPFKACANCGFVWPSRAAFLADPALEVIGYQVNFEELRLGLFLFNHTCRGTLSVAAGVFWDLYQGPIYKERATGGECCPGYCLFREELKACPAKCECAYVREILQILKSRPPAPPAS